MKPFDILEYDKQWLMVFFGSKNGINVEIVKNRNSKEKEKNVFDFEPFYDNLCEKTLQTITTENYSEKMIHLSDLTSELFQENMLVKENNKIFLSTTAKNYFKMEFRRLSTILPKIDFNAQWNIFLNQTNSRGEKLSVISKETDKVLMRSKTTTELTHRAQLIKRFKLIIISCLAGVDLIRICSDMMSDTTLTMNFIKFLTFLFDLM